GLQAVAVAGDTVRTNELGKVRRGRGSRRWRRLRRDERPRGWKYRGHRKEHKGYGHQAEEAPHLVSFVSRVPFALHVFICTSSIVSRQKANRICSCMFRNGWAPIAAPNPAVRGVRRVGSRDRSGRYCELATG